MKLHRPRAFMSSHDVALLFLHSDDWFYANRKAMEEEFNFPPPNAAVSSPNCLLWDPLDLSAWQDSMLTPIAKAALARFFAANDTATLSITAGGPEADNLDEIMLARAKKIAGTGP